jgi:hypothetical protein
MHNANYYFFQCGLSSIDKIEDNPLNYTIHAVSHIKIDTSVHSISGYYSTTLSNPVPLMLYSNWSYYRVLGVTP